MEKPMPAMYGERKSAKLIDAAAEIAGGTAGYEDRAFGAKCLVSAALPYRNPKPEQLVNGAWVRKNGDYTLWIQGGPQGLPYGTYPRIFVIWLTTEAIRTGNKRIVTGGNFSEFCRKLNVDRSRGKNGAGRRLVEQADKLLDSRAAFVEGDLNTSRLSKKDTEILEFSDKHTLFFDPDGSRQQTLFESEIILTEKFFREITEHCIPLDLRAVLALQQSPLELDVYQWLAYRMFTLRNPTYPTWQQLASQFGTTYSRLRDFRADFLKALHSVSQVYPRLNVAADDNGLILRPSLTPIPKKPASAE